MTDSASEESKEIQVVDSANVSAATAEVVDGELTPAADIAKLIAQWQAETVNELALTTQQTYAQGAGHYLSWLAATGFRPDAASTIRAWRDSLMAQPLAPSSINTWLAGVRAFYTWAHETGRIEANPAAGVRGPRRRGTSRRHKRDELTGTEIGALLKTCDDSPDGCRDRALIALIAYAALRAVECHRADVADLRNRDGRQVLWVQGKGRLEKDDFVVLNPAAEKALRAWLAEHPTGRGPLFVSFSNRSKGKRLSLRAISHAIKSRFRLDGIVGDTKTVHSLRHSAISTAIRNGATVQQVQAMARHANVGMTMIYYHEAGRTQNPAEDLIVYE